MDPSSGHRKIELQAPEDLSFLVANVRRAAQARLDEAFPPAAGPGTAGEDELRTQIEKLVQEFITQTFLYAGPNLSINGLDIAPSHLSTLLNAGISTSPATDTAPQDQLSADAYEPFDPRRRERIDALIREEEDLLSEIASLKRTAPRDAAARWERSARAALAADAAALEGARRAAKAAAEEEAATTVAGATVIKPLERQTEVEAAFCKAVEGLESLMTELPVTAAKMERARVAAEYVLGSKG